MIKLRTMKRYVQEFEQAARTDEFKYADPKETWADTENDYKKKKLRLYRALDTIYSQR